MNQFKRLVQLMKRLRGPRGCPWDRAQTSESLLPYLIEEAYEAQDALLRGNREHFKEELGDILLQVVFHAQMASEARRQKDRFTIEDVCRGISDKLVRRHPHVFGKKTARTPEDVMVRWEEIKQTEKKNADTGLLDSLPVALPALLKAHRMGQKAAHVGFDFENRRQVWGKVREELGEFAAELKKIPRHGRPGKKLKQRLEEELGDILCAVANLARHLEINPERALQGCNRRFQQRFRQVEKIAVARGVKLNDLTLREMDVLWEKAKKKGCGTFERVSNENAGTRRSRNAGQRSKRS